MPNWVSVFDPVLTEIMYLWFCPKNGTILDPFAGGSVRGVVASFMKLKYIGVSLFIVLQSKVFPFSKKPKGQKRTSYLLFYFAIPFATQD